jgi:tRNA(fMet)-specific endonuclease VapC
MTPYFPMTLKEQIIQELDHTPDGVLEQVFNFLKFLKATPPISPVQALPDLSDQERLARLSQLFGAWGNQPDLEQIFADIDRDRHRYQGREIPTITPLAPIMYLLDTNICIALMNGNRLAVSRFNRSFPQCHVSTIVVAELYKGIYLSQQRDANLTSLATLTQLLTITPFTIEAAEEFGQIQSELRRLGKPTGEIDALIAAVARSSSDILVTHNTSDFENIPNLQLDDWLI